MSLESIDNITKLQFLLLFEKYKEENNYFSSIGHTKTNIIYQTIVTEGKKYLPLIVEQLMIDPDWSLCEMISDITGKHPEIPVDARGI